MSLLERLASIRSRIEAAGRDPDEVTIVAVTKGRPAAVCREAVAAGLTVLGENRVHEAVAKMEEVDGGVWHLIGHLQSNKVRTAAGRFALIQSVDSVRLGEVIAARAPGQEILLEVNVSGDPGKHGCDPAQAVSVAAEVAPLLRLRGVMGMGPLGGDPSPAFAHLKRLHDAIEQRTGTALPVLSMGMSGDFEAAVAEGSTMVRLGRILFD